MKRCYRCRKPAQFFFTKKGFVIDKTCFFYDCVSYWDGFENVDCIKEYAFICSSCVVIEISLFRLSGESVRLMKKESDKDGYFAYNRSLKEWLRVPQESRR